MSTKKAAETALKTGTEIAQEDAALEKAAEELENMAKTAKAEDPWSVMVDMQIPRRKPGEAEEYYVCVNDRRYYIPKNGKRQSLPLPIAETLQNSLDAEAVADAFSEQMTESAMTQPK